MSSKKTPQRLSSLALALLGSTLFGLAACDQGTTTAASECASGERWSGGNQGSMHMHPGRDCVSCHTQGGGPRWAGVGTVYDTLTEQNDCFGVADVMVELTGADGKVVTLQSNDAGNFVVGKGKVATPYTAKVIYEGREQIMNTPQLDLNCASCHSATGANGAPGRIVAP